jgi:transposase
VGPLIATALIATVGNAQQFKSGRHLSAWLGLVPREHSSGERKILWASASAAIDIYAHC